jgi:hypothetical protein
MKWSKILWGQSPFFTTSCSRSYARRGCCLHSTCTFAKQYGLYNSTDAWITIRGCDHWIGTYSNNTKPWDIKTKSNPEVKGYCYTSIKCYAKTYKSIINDWYSYASNWPQQFPRNKGKCFAPTSIYKFRFISANHFQAMQVGTNLEY